MTEAIDPMQARGLEVATWMLDRMNEDAAQRGAPLTQADYHAAAGALINAMDSFMLLAHPESERAGYKAMLRFLEGMAARVKRRLQPGGMKSRR